MIPMSRGCQLNMVNLKLWYFKRQPGDTASYTGHSQSRRSRRESPAGVLLRCHYSDVELLLEEDHFCHTCWGDVKILLGLSILSLSSGGLPVITLAIFHNISFYRVTGQTSEKHLGPFPHRGQEGQTEAQSRRIVASGPLLICKLSIGRFGMIWKHVCPYALQRYHCGSFWSLDREGGPRAAAEWRISS